MATVLKATYSTGLTQACARGIRPRGRHWPTHDEHHAGPAEANTRKPEMVMS